MSHLLHSIVYGLIQALHPFVVPLCFVVAWLFVALVIWSLISSVREGVTKAREMHQIPCANCQFFTKSYHLKCPVHPSDALSEAAINCPDYEPNTHDNIYRDKARSFR